MKEFESKYTDFTSLKKETLGNKIIYKKLIELFLGYTDEYIQIMGDDLSNYEYSTLYGVTHKILSSIRIFGISALEPILLKLESNFLDKVHFNDLKKDIDTSLNIFKQVKIELQTELKFIKDV